MGRDFVVSTLFSDTDPKLEELQLQIIRRMPAWKKLAIVDDLNQTIRSLAISGIKQQHPDATLAEVHRMLAGLMLGEELAIKVYDSAK